MCCVYASVFVTIPTFSPTTVEVNLISKLVTCYVLFFSKYIFIFMAHLCLRVSASLSISPSPNLSVLEVSDFYVEIVKNLIYL